MKAHLYQMAQSAFELQLNRDFPKYKTMLEGWDGQQFFWQRANKAAMAEHFGVTMEDLRAEWDAAKRLFHKNRAAEISRDRTNKHNKNQALALWKVHTVSDIHLKFTELAAKEKELEMQIEKVKQQRQDDSILRAHSSIVEAAVKREAEYDARLQAAVQPEVDRQLALQKARYEEGAKFYEEQAKVLQQAEARYAALAATEEERNPSKDDQIRKLSRQVSDLRRDKMTLQTQVTKLESQEQQRKKRQANRENERQRRRMFANHSAVSTCTPESTSKRLKSRSSKTSALSRIQSTSDVNMIR